MGYLQKLITDAYSGPGSYDAAKSARLRALLGARRLDALGGAVMDEPYWFLFTDDWLEE